jgi:hypothetical protein
MQSIVCQVENQLDRISFTWSQGKDSFEPYHLGGDLAQDFADLAKELRAKLADVVTAYLEVARRPEQRLPCVDHNCWDLSGSLLHANDPRSLRSVVHPDVGR